jgi:formylglycine-generating enzyme required for sulfatase activity
MTERSSGQKRQTWIVRFGAAVVLIAIGVGWRGFSSPRSALAEESPGKPPKAQRLPDDLVGVSDAKYASLDGLAAGSREAQERQRQAVQQFCLPLEVKTAKTGIVFRLVPAGSFTMGSPKAEQYARIKSMGRKPEEFRIETERQVTLSEVFYCGKYEVTQGQWEQVMGSNPSYFKNAGKDAPVEQVSWDDCQEFLRKLCQMEGAAAGTYRLLTEAEWEYACRAGTQTAWYNGEIDIHGERSAPTLDAIAWYGGNSGVDYEGAVDSSRWSEKQYDHKRAGTHVVGGKRTNGFGLCDMIGNVWEWCQDSYYGEHPGRPLVGYRVFRGGCWKSCVWDCVSASRRAGSSPVRLDNCGLRLARTTPSSP